MSYTKKRTLLALFIIIAMGVTMGFGLSRNEVSAADDDTIVPDDEGYIYIQIAITGDYYSHVVAPDSYMPRGLITGVIKFKDQNNINNVFDGLYGVRYGGGSSDEYIPRRIDRPNINPAHQTEMPDGTQSHLETQIMRIHVPDIPKGAEIPVSSFTWDTPGLGYTEGSTQATVTSGQRIDEHTYRFNLDIPTPTQSTGDESTPKKVAENTELNNRNEEITYKLTGNLPGEWWFTKATLTDQLENVLEYVPGSMKIKVEVERTPKGRSEWSTDGRQTFDISKHYTFNEQDGKLTWSFETGRLLLEGTQYGSRASSGSNVLNRAIYYYEIEFRAKVKEGADLTPYIQDGEDKATIPNTATFAIPNNGEFKTDKEEVKVPLPEYVSLKVYKEWKDDDNKDGKRPDSIEVKILANGEDSGKTITLKKGEDDGNVWVGTSEDLDKHDADGKEITYSVAEADVLAGYTSSVKEGKPEDDSLDNNKIEELDDPGTINYTITNTYTPEEPTPEPEPDPDKPEPTPPTVEKDQPTPTNTPGKVTPKPVTKVVRTGDETALLTYFILALLSMAVIVYTVRRRKGVQK